jgi:hypothetical protein
MKGSKAGGFLVAIATIGVGLAESAATITEGSEMMVFGFTAARSRLAIA